MKLTKIGQVALTAAASLVLGLGITSCSPSNTIDYLFVTSNSPSGQIASYHVDDISGALDQVVGSPVSSGGNDPVALVASPNQQFLYVANRDSNNIALFTIGTDGQVALTGNPTITPGSRPSSIAINSTGTLLFVVDSYGPGFSETNPGPGALIVYPIASSGALGSPVVSRSLPYVPVQCFPSGVAVTPNDSFVYVTNTNAYLTTTSNPATIPPTGPTCPNQGTISGFSVASNGVLSPLAGSPYLAGSTPTGIAIDPTSRFLYATDSSQNQLIAYNILTSGGLYPLNNGPFATGTFPVGVVVDPRDQFIYVTNYNGGTVSEYNVNQAFGAPSANADGSTTSQAAGPTCIAVDPALGRYVYASDYLGADIGAMELDPNSGTLGSIQAAPYPSVGKPTCLVMVPHGNHMQETVSATAGQ